MRVYVPPTGCCIYTLGVASHVLILLVLRWFDVFGGWTFFFGQGLTVVALTLKGLSLDKIKRLMTRIVGHSLRK